MIKKFFMLSSLMGAVGVPYLLSTSAEYWSSFKGKFASSADSTPTEVATAAPLAPVVTHDPFDRSTSPATQALAKLPLEGYAAQDLNEVLNFGATPQWIIARWPRVTSGLSELDLQGYRVPLVTGTREDDLAGSLTYYFDKNQEMRYITFRGTTGNPHKIITVATTRYSLLQQATNDPGLLLYQVKWNGKPQSELRIRAARIVRAEQPRGRYDVEMALKRP